MLGEQARDGVDGRGHLGVLDAHGHEVVDGEEAAYVARRILPALQAVVLPGEQLVDRQLLGARPQRPPLRAEAQLAVAPLEAIDVERLAEDRQDHPAVRRLPIDVEPAGGRAVRTIAQHRPPRCVELRPADGDVVRHVVHEGAHPAYRQRVEQRPHPVDAAELGAHPGVVDDVVAVRAPGHRLGDRRQVDVTDAERLQTVQLRDDLGEPERRSQLEAVGGDGSRLEHRHALPIRVFPATRGPAAGHPRSRPSDGRGRRSISRSAAGVRRAGWGSSGGGGPR